MRLTKRGRSLRTATPDTERLAGDPKLDWRCEGRWLPREDIETGRHWRADRSCDRHTPNSAVPVWSSEVPDARPDPLIPLDTIRPEAGLAIMVARLRTDRLRQGTGPKTPLWRLSRTTETVNATHPGSGRTGGCPIAWRGPNLCRAKASSLQHDWPRGLRGRRPPVSESPRPRCPRTPSIQTPRHRAARQQPRVLRCAGAHPRPLAWSLESQTAGLALGQRVTTPEPFAPSV